MQTHGFEVGSAPTPGTYTNYENLDCATTVWHDYMKFVKFGFGRTTDHACIDVRLGRMTRSEAVAKVNELDGRYPRDWLGMFSDYLGFSYLEINSIVDSFVNWKLFDGKDETGNLRKRFTP